MIDWHLFALESLALSHDEAHPVPELKLVLRDSHFRTYSADKHLMELVADLRARRVLISGRPGSGKSYLLNWLHYQLAEQLEQEMIAFEMNISAMIQEVEDQATYSPTSASVVPILIRLNAFDSASNVGNPAFSTLVLKEENYLRTFGHEGTLSDFFATGCQFVVLIDDLDETVTTHTSRNLDDVKRFVDFVLSHRNVKVIMAGRLLATQRFEHSFRNYVVQNLDVPEISLLFAQKTRSSEELLAFLAKWDGISEVVSTPYFAHEAANFWESPGQREFNLGRLLFFLLDNGLVERQVKTENRIDRIRERLRARVETLEYMAFRSIRTNGRVSPTLLRLCTEDSVEELEEWLFLMEFVERNGAELRWTNKWVQAYFAAHFLSRDDIAETKVKRVQLLVEPSSDAALRITPALTSTVFLLQDLTGEDYSSEFPEIWDELEASFSERERQMLTAEFERLVAHYIQKEHDFPPGNIECPFKPPFLQPYEVDVYAEKDEGNRRVIWVVECKLRFPRYPKNVKLEFMEQLQKHVDRVREVKSFRAHEDGKSLQLSAILATNGNGGNEHARSLAKQYNAEIWNFQVPATKLTGRISLTDYKRDRFY